MTKTSVVNVRVDDDVKQNVERLFNDLGMNISTAVNMFFRQVIADQALPFHPKTNRRSRISLEERLKGFEGEYVFEEWDTGAVVGREVIP